MRHRGRLCKRRRHHGGVRRRLRHEISRRVRLERPILGHDLRGVLVDAASLLRTARRLVRENRPATERLPFHHLVRSEQLDTVLDIVSRGADVLGRCPQDPASAPKTLNGWAGDGMCRATRDVYVSVNELGKNKWHKVGIGEQPSASALVNKQNIRMLTSNPATSGLNWVLGSVLETIALLRRRGLPLFHSPSRCLSLSR